MVLYVVCVIISLQAVAAAELFERENYMEKYSETQIRTLKKLDECGGIDIFDIQEFDENLYVFLETEGLIACVPNKSGTTKVVITEKGKACISSNRYKVLTDWVPITLSAISIILSIIALFVSISK